MTAADDRISVRIGDKLKAELAKHAEVRDCTLSDLITPMIQLSKRVFVNDELMNRLYHLSEDVLMPAGVVLEAIVISYFARLEAMTLADVEDKVQPAMPEFTIADGKALTGEALFDYLVKIYRSEIEREDRERKEWERQNDAQHGVTPEMLAAARGESPKVNETYKAIAASNRRVLEKHQK